MAEVTQRNRDSQPKINPWPTNLNKNLYTLQLSRARIGYPALAQPPQTHTHKHPKGLEATVNHIAVPLEQF